MHLGDFERCEQDLKQLDRLLPNDSTVKKLYEEYEKLKEESVFKKKKYTKKGLFNLYEEKEEKKKPILPLFDKENKCFFLDIVFDEDLKNPQKLKFEIFKETQIRYPSLFKYLTQSIESKKLKGIEAETVLDEVDLELDYTLNTIPCCELYLLCLRKIADKHELIISKEISSEKADNIIVLGRCYYNKNCLKGDRRFRIIECDYTYNI
jgi:hypothetical protein